MSLTPRCSRSAERTDCGRNRRHNNRGGLLLHTEGFVAPDSSCHLAQQHDHAWPGGQLLLSMVVLSCMFACSSARALSAPSRSFGTEIREKGCGLISAYVALRSIGVECSLRDLVAGTGWDSAPRPLSLYDVCQVVNRQNGAHAEGRLLGIPDVQHILEKTKAVVILAIKKNGAPEVNHTVVACSYTDGKFVLYDYPEQAVEKSADELEQVYGGLGVVVTRTPASLRGMRGAFLGVFLSCGFVWGVSRLRSARSWGNQQPQDN